MGYIYFLDLITTIIVIVINLFHIIIFQDQHWCFNASVKVTHLDANFLHVLPVVTESYAAFSTGLTNLFQRVEKKYGSKNIKQFHRSTVILSIWQGMLIAVKQVSLYANSRIQQLYNITSFFHSY